MAASWLKKACFYEIYPQSFYDSNGDGIGDINGIAEKLDYIQSLGCNALWLNPVYDSPFKDAGYDVRDYFRVAPRYGTNEDLKELVRVAHEKGIRVLLDLVPGHSSEECAWFRQSGQEEENEYSHRYIWTSNAFCNGDGLSFIGGEMPRNATYIINFFKCQPSLNYGFREPKQPWQMHYEAEEPRKTRRLLESVMRFWLDMGCDGFRVDMADSLVKHDGPDRKGTMAVWSDILGNLHRDYPEAAFVSEWNNPALALNCGFDMDFFLDWRGNGYSVLLRDYDIPKFGQPFGKNDSYFCADSQRDISGFLQDYLPKYQQTKDAGLWCLITGNHDTLRVAPLLDDRERRVAFGFLLTMPGAPFLYYGDEIGMPYRWVPTKEGGYQRTGSRTPMQWTLGENLGFSTAPADQLYLPVDDAEDAANVATQEQDPDSFLHYVRSLIALRHKCEDLGNYSTFEVYSAQPGSRLFAYKRCAMLLAVNPGREVLSLELDGTYKAVFCVGDVTLTEHTASMGAQSFVVLQPME